MRKPRKPDDIPVLAAWLFWEMILEDDDGDDPKSGKQEPPKPPSRGPA